MKKESYFHDFVGPGWPASDDLKKYFLKGGERLWASHGNDNWRLSVEGLYGTDALPRRESVNVNLDMIGSPDHGVRLHYAKWDGRVQRKDTYVSKGDLNRLGRFMYSLHGDPYSLGLFIPFEAAFKAVKEFIERDGELPTSIAWVAVRDLPSETFPVPTWPPQKLPG
jgi:Immunity protein Imm1